MKFTPIANDIHIVLWVGYVALKTIPLMTTLMALLILTKFPLCLFFYAKKRTNMHFKGKTFGSYKFSS